MLSGLIEVLPVFAARWLAIRYGERISVSGIQMACGPNGVYFALAAAIKEMK